MKTPITVRAQARGGKFLADDIGGSEVTLSDAGTGRLLAAGRALGTSSGNLQPAYQPGAAPEPVVTPGSPPTVQWLVPVAETSAFRAELDLSAPTCLEVTVRGPLAGLQSAGVATDRVWALPGRPLDLVVELPGLVVQALAPATHDELTLPAKVPFRAKVTMMCGCQIGEGLPWVPDDFEVSAAVGPVGQGAATRVKLAFSGQPSLFHHHGFEVTEPGYYEAWITAVQKSTGNAGTALVTFYAPPPS